MISSNKQQTSPFLNANTFLVFDGLQFQCYQRVVIGKITVLKKANKKIAQSVGFAVCSLQFVFYHDCPHPFSVCKLLQTQREISSFFILWYKCIIKQYLNLVFE